MRVALSLILLSMLIACDSQEVEPSSATTDTTPHITGFDPAQCSYELDGQFVSLHAGHHQQNSVDGVSNQSTTLVQTIPLLGHAPNESESTLVAVVLEQRIGSASPMYYVAIAYDQDGACTGTNAQPLGGRVKLESARLEGSAGVQIVGYELVEEATKSARAKLAREWQFRFEQGELLPMPPKG